MNTKWIETRGEFNAEMNTPCIDRGIRNGSKWIQNALKQIETE
jgi:hypothetical protein